MSTTSTEEPSSCPLLSLPAELRLQIYQYALHPTGTLTLTSTKTNRYAVEPRVSPSLLSTCRQIHHEASQLLYAENAIFLTLDAHETYWPPVAESRLPQRALENVQHLCVIFDCTTLFHASYEEVDFAAFEALINLKTLRVSMIHATEDLWGGAGRPAVERGAELFTEVLMRVPKDTRVLCGIEEGTQEGKFLEDVVAARREGRKLPHVTQVVEKEDLEAAVALVPEEARGLKSGGNEDVFAAYREEQQYHGRTFAMI